MQIHSFDQEKLIRRKTILSIFLISILIIPVNVLSDPGVLPDHTRTDGPDTRSTAPFWHYDTLWADELHLNDIAITDILSSTPGDEIITVSDNYLATMIFGNGDSWKTKQIFADNFHLKSVCVGDFYPSHPGNEIAIAGFRGIVTMHYYIPEEDRFYTEEIYEDYDFLYDVAVGDIDPSHPGDELVCVGESRRLSYIYWDLEEKKWSSEIIWKDRDLLNVVSVGDVDPADPGLEILVTGGTFNITLITGSPGNWIPTTIWKDSTFIREILVSEFHGNTSSPELFIAGYSKKLTMLSLNTTGAWQAQTLWRDKGTVGDVIAVDYTVDYNGTELITVGASGAVAMIYRSSSGYGNVTLYSTTNPPTTIVYGDFDLQNDGNEFALAEFVGKLTSLYAEDYGFSFFSPLSSHSVVNGERFQIDLLAISNGGFKERVFLSYEIIEVFSPWVRSNNSIELVKFESTSLIPTDFTGVEIWGLLVPGGKMEIGFLAQSETMTRQFNVTLNFVYDQKIQQITELKGVNISLSPRLTNIVADRTSNFLVELNGFTTTYFAESFGINYEGYSYTKEFFVENGPIGISLTTYIKNAEMSQNSSKHVLSLRADANVPTGKYHIFIISETTIREPDGSILVRFERARILELTVEGAGSPDFFVELSSNSEPVIFQGEEFEWTVSLNTLGGFTGSVNIGVENSSGLFLDNAPGFITASQTDKMKVKAPDDMEPTTAYLIITGVSNERYRFNIVSLEVLRSKPGIDLTIDPLEVTITRNESAEFDITIAPTNNYTGKISIHLYHLDSGRQEWSDYTLYLDIAETEILKLVIVNLTRSGEYNFSIEVLDPQLLADTNVKVTVKEPGQPGVSENDDDGTDEEGLTTTQSIIIIAAGVLIIILVIFVYSRRPKKVKERPKDKDKNTKRTKNK